MLLSDYSAPSKQQNHFQNISSLLPIIPHTHYHRTCTHTDRKTSTKGEDSPQKSSGLLNLLL